tara:strand:+ start:77 stop:220 length:144 start_codon:yes stop_codon:yes gene_type:complete
MSKDHLETSFKLPNGKTLGAHEFDLKEGYVFTLYHSGGTSQQESIVK